MSTVTVGSVGCSLNTTCRTASRFITVFSTRMNRGMSSAPVRPGTPVPPISPAMVYRGSRGRARSRCRSGRRASRSPPTGRSCPPVSANDPPRLQRATGGEDAHRSCSRGPDPSRRPRREQFRQVQRHPPVEGAPSSRPTEEHEQPTTRRRKRGTAEQELAQRERARHSRKYVILAGPPRPPSHAPPKHPRPPRHDATWLTAFARGGAARSSGPPTAGSTAPTPTSRSARPTRTRSREA